MTGQQRSRLLGYFQRSDGMKVSELRCTNCRNVDVKIDWKKKSFYCPSCGTHFVFERDSDNKKTYIVNMINTPQDTPNSVEEQLRSAKYFLEKLKNYDKAKELYERVTEKAPHDYRGWWGLVRVDNYNFNSRKALEHGLDPHEYEQESDYLRCALIAASENMSHKLRTRWNDYVQRYDCLVNQNEIADLQSRLDAIEKEISESDDKIRKSISDYCVLSAKVIGIIGACLSVLMILSDHGNLWNILLIGMVCVFLVVICYNNLFGIVEIIFKDLYDLLGTERAKIRKLTKERSRLTKQITQLSGQK